MDYSELALLMGIGIFILVVLGIVILGYVLQWEWTGLPRYTRTDEVEKRPVTLWAWMGILLVPLTLAVGATLFTWSQHRNDLAVQQQQRKTDLEVQESRAQDERLRDYFDKVGTLLVDKNLDSKKYSDKESDVARAQTLTLLYSADALHKRSALQFLYEADLITKGKQVVLLDNANLTDADLSWLDLHRAHMENVFLQRAYLNNASLRGINLTNSNLGGGKGAEGTPGATLENADLTDAVLKGADLHYSNFTNADLTGADLTDNGEVSTKLGGANLDGAILEGTHLRGTDLREVKNLKQEQIDRADGDKNTQLPDDLQQPESWE